MAGEGGERPDGSCDDNALSTRGRGGGGRGKTTSICWSVVTFAQLNKLLTYNSSSDSTIRSYLHLLPLSSCPSPFLPLLPRRLSSLLLLYSNVSAADRNLLSQSEDVPSLSLTFFPSLSPLPLSLTRLTFVRDKGQKLHAKRHCCSSSQSLPQSTSTLASTLTSTSTCSANPTT